MDPPATRDRIRVEVLGVGAQWAAVEGLEPVRYHGMPGLVWRVRVRLSDGTRPVGLATASGDVWFADPRVRPVRTDGTSRPVRFSTAP